MAEILLVIATIFCAYRLMRSQRLMSVTIWLAVVSALVATQLYLLGAYEVAVMELSVGAGLVTVLFVFAFSIVGEETFDPLTIVPRPLVWLVVLLLVILLGWMSLPLVSAATTLEIPFATVLWEQRGLDVLVQVVIILAGVMGLIGLLSEAKHPAKSGRSEETPVEAPDSGQPDLEQAALEEVGL